MLSLMRESVCFFLVLFSFFGFDYPLHLHCTFSFLFQLTACMDNKHYYDSYYISAVVFSNTNLETN
ncbi:hypothetical protein BDV39DRAFT_168463 [Aspergillus sergii]|uniref:Uncharacterized protein n=1 Tax=Aspergillus sergii TaxID=1034303 RepID=A0A5N6XG53_9EURO|nr:hypothetical protein BDV39DRAFT_168463 [Aspergillus sergii]